MPLRGGEEGQKVDNGSRPEGQGNGNDRGKNRLACSGPTGDREGRNQKKECRQYPRGSSEAKINPRGRIRGGKGVRNGGRRLNFGHPAYFNPVTKNYKIMYANIRSLRSKLQEFKARVSITSPDIILLCETWLNGKDPDSFLTLPNYEIIIRQDGRDTSEGIGRGLLVYCKTCLNATPIENSLIKDVNECVGIEINFDQTTSGN